ncbi:hypothetical protein [Streptomyces sp. NPDC005865]|uniref:hypothetical protein n=1 Tax=Streptomyces sp. NPDC005865 TaxID=3155453 RepID=UPI0033C94A55
MSWREVSSDGVVRTSSGSGTTGRPRTRRSCERFVAVEIELRTAFLADRAHRLDLAPWNAALVALSLVATREVAAAAAELTGAVGRFAELVARSPKTREDLREIQEALAKGQLRFVNAARISLDHSQPPLDWQLGGPPAWAMTEPYAPDPAANEPA